MRETSYILAGYTWDLAMSLQLDPWFNFLPIATSAVTPVVVRKVWFLYANKLMMSVGTSSRSRTPETISPRTPIFTVDGFVYVRSRWIDSPSFLSFEGNSASFFPLETYYYLLHSFWRRIQLPSLRFFFFKTEIDQLATWVHACHGYQLHACMCVKMNIYYR
jgi:hypothetical protein